MVAVRETQMGFAANLRRLRQARGWTQGQAAESLGVAFRTYQNWEGGSREPKLSILPQIATAFGVPVGELLTDDDQADADPPEDLPPRAGGKRK